MKFSRVSGWIRQPPFAVARKALHPGLRTGMQLKPAWQLHWGVLLIPCLTLP